MMKTKSYVASIQFVVKWQGLCTPSLYIDEYLSMTAAKRQVNDFLQQYIGNLRNQ